MHLESEGHCARKLGLTRAKILKFVANTDTDRRLLVAGVTANTKLRLDDPQSAGATLPSEPSNYDDDEIVELARHTCGLCPPERSQFCSAEALNEHMASPYHDTPVYRCPEGIATRGRTTFRTLSGLSQHIETGVCGGRDTFAEMLTYVTEKLRSVNIQIGI